MYVYIYIYIYICSTFYTSRQAEFRRAGSSSLNARGRQASTQATQSGVYWHNYITIIHVGELAGDAGVNPYR